MRWRIDGVRAVALVLVVVLFVVGFAGNRAIAFVIARFDPVDFFIIGLGLWPVLLLAVVAFGAWTVLTRSKAAEDLPVLGCLALLLAPVLIVLVGAVALNWRVVSCSMPDRTACPDVLYQDIRLLKDDGIADPYSMDFREPVWPEGLEPVPRLGGADWLMEYKTWGDGDYWALCSRLPDESVECGLLEGTDEYQ